MARAKRQASEKLTHYREKRDFALTPEPPGQEAHHGEKPPRRFVIQEHHASHLHWDLRLEREGVLVSWAVPKGIPADPHRNNLAVHTEDHPLAYVDFHGTIPAGQYGAGEMYIWDQGTYECEKFEPKKVVVILHGKRAKGKYALFQTKGKNWMIHRMDPPLDATAEPMPEAIVPMFATLGTLPKDDSGWGYEIKWDGIRAIMYVEGGRIRVESRNLNDITQQYPELRKLGEAMGSRTAVFDGEIVAFGLDGKPSFSRLQQRFGVSSPAAVRRRMGEVPATYILFDLLYFEGHRLMDLPYEERRTRLERLKLNGPHWQTPAYYRDGKAMLTASKEQGLEGIIAKQLECPYVPGKRSLHWRKVKNQQRQEFVVAGWYPGEGNREGRIGALLLGYYDKTLAEAKALGKPQQLLFAGKVGTGFTYKTLDDLTDKLIPLKRKTSPFSGKKQPERRAVFAEPKYVAEIEYTEWTHENILRHPSFKGLRMDKPPTEVVREEI